MKKLLKKVMPAFISSVMAASIIAVPVNAQE